MKLPLILALSLLMACTHSRMAIKDKDFVVAKLPVTKTNTSSTAPPILPVPSAPVEDTCYFVGRLLCVTNGMLPKDTAAFMRHVDSINKSWRKICKPLTK